VAYLRHARITEPQKSVNTEITQQQGQQTMTEPNGAESEEDRIMAITKLY
jgi:hypothetical protein